MKVVLFCGGAGMRLRGYSPGFAAGLERGHAGIEAFVQCGPRMRKLNHLLLVEGSCVFCEVRRRRRRSSRRRRPCRARPTRP